MFLCSLIKMTYWISQKTGKCLTLNQLQHCLKRNFSGRLDTDKTIQIFRRNILSDVLESELTASDFEVNIIYLFVFDDM